MKNKKIVPIIVSVIAMLSVICISSFTREKPPKKQNDINNIAALSSKATADTPESDEEMRGVWVSYMELSMENESSKTQKAFEDKFTEIAQKCCESGFNTLIVQVRPFVTHYISQVIFHGHIFSRVRRVKILNMTHCKLCVIYAKKTI